MNMNGFMTEPIIISAEQSREFMDSLRNPNRDELDKRDEMFQRMDEEMFVCKNGTDFTIDMPNVDLSFIKEIAKQKDESICIINEMKMMSSDKLNVNGKKWIPAFCYEKVFNALSKIQIKDDFISIGTMTVENSSVYINNDNYSTTKSTETEQLRLAS